MTLGAYLSAWTTTLRGAVAANTYTAYEGVTRLHLIPALGWHPLAIRRNAIRLYLLELRRAGRTAEVCGLHLAVLRRALQDAVDADPPLLESNPASNLWRRLPPEMRRVQDPGRFAIDAEDGPRLLTALRERHHALHRVVCVYARGALRRNEALGLQVPDLSFGQHTIDVRRQYHGAGRVGPPKGRRPRTIDMAESLESVLVAAIHESTEVARRLGCAPEPAWVFRSPRTGLPWSPRAVNAALSEVSRAVLGRSLGPKAFRHTVASVLMNGGESPRYVQLLLGHAHLTTTMQYVEHAGLRRRAALDRLG